jgi:ABC-type transport system involved in Fe-S cluster assembly fused permease/ATPase subunit
MEMHQHLNDEIINACKFAAVEDFIEKLPNKYETIIGENGVEIIWRTKTKIINSKSYIKKFFNHIIGMRLPHL